MDRKQIEDIYPLSPMQQGMLFDTVYLAGTGIYVERNAIQLTGELDTAVFERTWAKIVARHPILRTLFLWENRDTPLQVVRKEAQLPLRHLDWRHLPADSHQSRLDKFLDDERQNEFDLKQAPLLRLTLIRLAEDAYYLGIVFHHIIIDRWSIGLLLNEMFSLYRAEKRGEHLRLAPVRPYGDYIGWLQQQDPARLETFWRENLAGFTAPTPFNIETSRRPTVGEASYRQAETWLSEASQSRLTAFARQHRLTLNTIVQGAWALLLHHYSGESDVLFGATVAGRPADLPGVEQMVGLFINTLPVRVQIPAQTPLIDWLKRLQGEMAVLQQVSHTPLVDVQGWSDVAAGSPLFESIIVFENIPVGGMPADTGLAVSGVGVTVRGQMAYPLTITVNPNDRGRIWLQVTYELERFETQAIQRLTGYLKTLLENIPDHESQPITAVPYLSPAEQAQLLAEFSGAGVVTAVPDPFVHRRIAQQAAQTPGALALATIKPAQRPSFFLDAGAEMPQASLTYAELNGRANQLARHLIKLGAGPEKIVAVHRARSAETLVCLLAILKAGGVFLPLDPDLPDQRLAHILADAQPAVAITDAESAVDWQGIPTFCPEQIAEQIGDYSTGDVERPLTPDNSAYLIYTSGTTGQPKGVLVPHRALANHTQAIVKQFSLSPDDRVLQFAALSFDVALEEIFPTWLAGAALLLRPLDVPALDEFNQLIHSEQLTVLNIPAPYWHEWVAEITHSWEIEITRTPLFSAAESLRLVIVGSDKVMAEKLTQWQELIPQRIQLLNGYGPTEATITATLYPADSMPDGLSVAPLGRPLANVTAYVLDGNGRPTPIGVTGELYLGGAGLAHGYLNQPRQTAAAFIPDPFSSKPGQRLYRTGDLVRWLPNGSLAFVGRTDHQVKIRGFRIELEEIENSLTRHSGVRQAVVTADASQERLAAYILPGDFSLTAKSLQTWAESQLPAYMVPGSWRLLDAFPLTASGKVNRQALPEPSFDNGRDTYVAPRSLDEQTIAAIWSEVLDVEKVGIHDNFFQLGGHSLRATQIVSRMRQQLGWDVPIRAIFESPTIAGLSARFAPRPAAEPITDDEVMAELMDELDGLSDMDLDELESMLDFSEHDLGD
jgi:amino acid adenylation domain-containing protein